MIVSQIDARPFWFLVKSKPLQERRLEEGLGARQIPAYCPRMMEPFRPMWAPKGPVPLFQGYVFGHFTVRDQFSAAHYAPGASGLVRFGAGFAAVEEAFVADLRAREAERGYIQIDTPPRHLRPGSRVRIAAGPLAGVEGIVSRYLPGHERVKLLLHWACSVQSAEVDARSLRRA